MLSLIRQQVQKSLLHDLSHLKQGLSACSIHCEIPLINQGASCKSFSAQAGQAQPQESEASHSDAHSSNTTQGSSSATSSAEEADTQAAFRPSRFLQLQQQVLQREMMLKMGSMRRWQELPYLKSLTLTIDSQSDTRLGADATEKKNLMLHALALEHIAGQPAAFITHNQRSMHMASGVQVVLTGAKGLDMLEKLIYLILPNQMSFEGIPVAQPVKPPPKKVPKGKPQPEEAPTKLFAVDLRIDNILLFPDLEKNFELFEPVRSMQVRVSVDQAPSAEIASLYLAGFGLPLLGR